MPIAPFRAVRNAYELANAVDQIGRPAILKTAAFGYDGKGQQMIDARDDFEEIWKAGSADELVLEGAIDFDKEISVIVARGIGRQVSTIFPLCRKSSSQSHPRHHGRASALAGQ